MSGDLGYGSPARVFRLDEGAGERYSQLHRPRPYLTTQLIGCGSRNPLRLRDFGATTTCRRNLVLGESEIYAKAIVSMDY
jgi:hypothetical protein